MPMCSGPGGENRDNRENTATPLTREELETKVRSALIARETRRLLEPNAERDELKAILEKRSLEVIDEIFSGSPMLQRLQRLSEQMEEFLQMDDKLGIEVEEESRKKMRDAFSNLVGKGDQFAASMRERAEKMKKDLQEHPVEPIDATKAFATACATFSPTVERSILSEYIDHFASFTPGAWRIDPDQVEATHQSLAAQEESIRPPEYVVIPLIVDCAAEHGLEAATTEEAILATIREHFGTREALYDYIVEQDEKYEATYQSFQDQLGELRDQANVDGPGMPDGPDGVRAMLLAQVHKRFWNDEVRQKSKVLSLRSANRYCDKVFGPTDSEPTTEE